MPEPEIAQPILTQALTNSDAFDRLVTVHWLAALIHDMAAVEAAVGQWDELEAARREHPTDPALRLHLKDLLQVIKDRAGIALESLERFRAECENELQPNPEQRPDPIRVNAEAVRKAVAAFGTGTVDHPEPKNPQ